MHHAPFLRAIPHLERHAFEKQMVKRRSEGFHLLRIRRVRIKTARMASALATVTPPSKTIRCASRLLLASAQGLLTRKLIRTTVKKTRTEVA